MRFKLEVQVDVRRFLLKVKCRAEIVEVEVYVKKLPGCLKLQVFSLVLSLSSPLRAANLKAAGVRFSADRNTFKRFPSGCCCY